MELLNIFLMGKKYQVPSELTIQKALEYVGFQIIRGCGCRGGVCGACAVLYRMPGSVKIHAALSCVTLIKEEMAILNLPYFPTHKAIYQLNDLKPTAESIAALYPEVLKCMGCNSCTKTCPQNIPVMNVIASALKGDIENAAMLSSECVMCGLCAARCPGELTPYHIALLCKRLYGRHMLPAYPHVINRIRQIDSGFYDQEMTELLTMSIEQWREEYQKAQKDKQII